ncbi:MAG: hypothetical protein JJE30_14560 [Desulfuromonadales bacterium]|nr:hypothetical protein [Desulfuromonadales bacterium]
MSRQSCAVCAWRENCNKRFSVCDGGSRCPGFSRDISIKDSCRDYNNTTEIKESHKK